MLDRALFAFLVMTGEDQHGDGTTHARENVIHEAGLFQGRLGFEKAIILLEEGCAEFSNIHGLTKTGARVCVAGPATMITRDIEKMGVLLEELHSPLQFGVFLVVVQGQRLPLTLQEHLHFLPL